MRRDREAPRRRRVVVSGPSIIVKEVDQADSFWAYTCDFGSAEENNKVSLLTLIFRKISK